MVPALKIPFLDLLAHVSLRLQYGKLVRVTFLGHSFLVTAAVTIVQNNKKCSCSHHFESSFEGSFIPYVLSVMQLRPLYDDHDDEDWSVYLLNNSVLFFETSLSNKFLC